MLRTLEHGPDYRANMRLAVKLWSKGLALNSYQFHDGHKPYCDDPVRVCRANAAGGLGRAVEVSFFAPCRKCEKCLHFRKLHWRYRAMKEIERSNRTWALTLTYSPIHLTGVLYEAQERFHKHDARSIDACAYAHVQRFFKRLRAETKQKFRYLAVFELGEKTGRPHYHILMHEIERPITKVMIEKNWRSFSAPRLVDKGDVRDRRRKASYITSYATKSFDIRPRASSRYGKPLVTDE